MTHKAIIRSDRTIAKIFKRLMGREYLLGGSGKTNGAPFDCWGMLNEYIRLRYSHDIYSNLGKYNEIAHNYITSYIEEPNALLSNIKDLLEERFNKIGAAFKRGGDIIVTSSKAVLTLGIYGGNDILLITSPNTGCIVMNLSLYDDCFVYRDPKIA